jgi:hypothetical protein
LARGGAYTFGGGKGSRAGSGLSLARIALRVRMRGENGYLWPSANVVKLLDERGGFFVGYVKVLHDPDMGSLIAFMNLIEHTER